MHWSHRVTAILNRDATFSRCFKSLISFKKKLIRKFLNGFQFFYFSQ
jgi:hypothetical protein